MQRAPLKVLVHCFGRGGGGLQLKLGEISCTERRLAWGAKSGEYPLSTAGKASARRKAASAEQSSVVVRMEASPPRSTGQMIKGTMEPPESAADCSSQDLAERETADREEEKIR